MSYHHAQFRHHRQPSSLLTMIENQVARLVRAAWEWQAVTIFVILFVIFMVWG